MAMLAEPRRKQKVINLRAKNNAWSNDSNKFGQRMLEKMGWSSGKGLGANENGIVEHVVARYKNDERGLGFEDRNDQWTKHEDDFNALLANLSNADDDKELQSHSGVSLEVKSKKSKARVHFHKFTRAKDLSRYSEKDLANIFGKKTLKSDEKKEELLNDNVKTTEQVFTEKGSMTDYFKDKLLALSSKNKIPLTINDNSYDNADCGFRGFSGTTNDEPELENTCLGIGFQPFDNSNAQKDDENDNLIEENQNEVKITEESSECLKNIKKKKKSKKNTDTDIIVPVNNEEGMSLNKKQNPTNIESENGISNDILKGAKTEKSKKSKLKRELDNNPTVVEYEEVVSIKKKSKKKKGLHQEKEEATNQDENHADYIPKKKKKKKNKELEN